MMWEITLHHPSPFPRAQLNSQLFQKLSLELANPSLPVFCSGCCLDFERHGGPSSPGVHDIAHHLQNVGLEMTDMRIRAVLPFRSSNKPLEYFELGFLLTVSTVRRGLVVRHAKNKKKIKRKKTKFPLSNATTVHNLL